MYMHVDFALFRNEFERRGRKDHFSNLALEELYDYLIQLEEDTCYAEELDVIALCVQHTEYANLAEFHKDYPKDKYPTIDDIEYETNVIRVDCKGNGTDEDGRFIIANF